jgi:hypothetical protein
MEDRVGIENHAKRIENIIVKYLDALLKVKIVLKSNF